MGAPKLTQECSLANRNFAMPHRDFSEIGTLPIRGHDGGGDLVA
jgi:hypothetical protein